ncbi:hypothetical protein [Streptomyces sp. 351MFTsu5.1]|uniref:hypothetical protein n=1 Tax=Streptomyces sp. 351MFTsu5.1 TaxID=1172180 RepID=UPI00035EFA8B|nr:hypothetical protein [Streptomyces sp. 351MFTsu5.1]
MSNLVDHARRELALIGEDQDVIDGIAKVIEAFTKVADSGGSTPFVIARIEKLMRFEPLSPLTDDPAEWQDQSEASGVPLWQSTRNPSAFSTDGGKTYTLLGEEPQTSDSGQPVHASQPKAV